MGTGSTPKGRAKEGAKARTKTGKRCSSFTVNIVTIPMKKKWIKFVDEDREANGLKKLTKKEKSTKFTYSFVRAYKALERENQLDGVDVIPKEEYQRCMMEYKTKHGVRAWLDLMKQHRLHVDSCSQKQKFLKA